MATSSIMKTFYVQDEERFEKLKQELESKPTYEKAVESPSLEKGREKLAAFVFR